MITNSRVVVQRRMDSGVAPQTVIQKEIDRAREAQSYACNGEIVVIHTPLWGPSAALDLNISKW